jgi:RimJ/RimL family protein N-acetyltransferase
MKSIKLRPATMEDSDKLLEWKNDPVMRKFSIVTGDIIKKEDHIKWLRKHLDEIYIIEGDDLYGDIRFEGDEIAIKLDPKFRGQGIGRQALEIAKLMKDTIIAKIVDGNVASMALFTRSGFKVIDHQDNYYILKYGI